jgi:SAM-dependent methyltransferase
MSRWNLGSALPETLRSLRDFGLLRTLSVMRSRLQDMAFDARHGTDTVQTVAVDALDVEAPRRSLGQRYQPTGSSALGKILRALPIGADDGFVDFGCGKGRTLILAMDFPFRRIVGVEFSAALCAIARANIATVSGNRPARPGRPPNVQPEVAQCDARDYTLAGDETVFYFFHPFGEPVLAPVLDNIEASLRRAPRPAWLIYYLPVHRTVIDRSAAFALHATRVVNGYDCLTYRHQPSSPTPPSEPTR